MKRREKDRIERFDKLQKHSTNIIKTFLDVGCGEGYSLLEAYNRGWIIYGQDIYDHRNEEIKKINNHFIKAELFDASFPDNFFDIVYLDSVLEHVQNPLEYLLEIKRIMKVGSILYVGVPNEDSLLNVYRKFFFKLSGKKTISEKLMPFKTPYHIGGFNSYSLDYIVEKVKLRVIIKKNFACHLEFLKYPLLSVGFYTTLSFLPIYLLAALIKKEVYFELYLEKNSN
ncbi:MAG: class I SAM-dependent methyltransferase [Ignavibacteriaceae bacterium]|nr:class I SAM-dependent methyltransferase [Ignavibacteriaceae bacterium]